MEGKVWSLGTGSRVVPLTVLWYTAYCHGALYRSTQALIIWILRLALVWYELPFLQIVEMIINRTDVEFQLDNPVCVCM